MNLDFSTHGAWTVVAVKGRVDTVTAPQFEEQVRERIAQGANRIVVDLSGVDYVSSAGLRCILVAARDSKAKGGELACCGLHGVVKKVFEVSGFSAMLPVFDSAQDALARE